jgi:23S rRNA (uracil1939-C5)-methyltransferase
MLARHERQVVFVAGAIAGERVRARVQRVTRQLAFADAIDVLDPSADRRPATADWTCGGSVYAHIAYRRQLSLKSELIADALARIGKINLTNPVDIMASAEDGYRMRARLHARNGRIGFFREGTHELCDAGATRQLLPATIDALARLERALAASREGAAVSCEISENIPADERAVLVEYDNGRADLGPGYDSPYVADHIDVAGASVTLRRHARSFFQANRWLLPDLVARVIAQVPDGGAVDLYAGAGVFAVSLAAIGRGPISAVEGDRFSAADLEHNASPFGDTIAVSHTSVETYLQRRASRDAHTVVVDPPRTGISSEAMSGILALKAPKIVYVSCDVATLARDARRFVEAGYRLEHIEAFDLFPNTAHVETLAVFGPLVR